MARVGDCPPCAGIGEELPGVRCRTCDGAGGTFACPSLECASTPSERPTPPLPLAAQPEPAAPLNGHALEDEPEEHEAEPNVPRVRYDLLPPPERMRSEYHAGEHCFQDGRCLACGKLEMLAARYGWPCQERGHFR
jgi:hypothetical protein